MSPLDLARTPVFLDAVIALTVGELVVLAAVRAATGRGMPVPEAVAFLGAGIAMLVALRVRAADGPATWFAVAMGASLVLHLWHVVQRWRR